MFLSNYNSPYNPLKLVLPAGLAKNTPTLLTLFSQYDFLDPTEFFDSFNNLTSHLKDFDILVRVILFLPDYRSEDDFFYFLVKTFETSFFISNFIIIPEFCTLLQSPNKRRLEIKVSLNLSLILKIILINSFFISFLYDDLFPSKVFDDDSIHPYKMPSL